MPRGSATNTTEERTAPPVKPSDVTNTSNGWNPPGHNGIDLITNGAKPMYACVRAKVIDARNGGWWSKGATGDISKGDGVVRIKALEDVGDVKKGTIFGYGHAEHVAVRVGQTVEPGAYLGLTGLANAWHTHWFVGRPGSDARDGQVDPKPYWDAFKKGKAELAPSTGEAAGSDGGGTGSIDLETVEKISKAAAFATYLEVPGLFDTAESMALKGDRSLMNDKPLLPFIQQLCRASLRSFQSLPNGDFFAFYPDYFGGLNHRTAYWDVSDLEILDGQVQLNDQALATHVYVVGDIASHFDGVNIFDKTQSGGVVTIFNAFLADFINPTVFEEQKKQSKNAEKDKKDKKVKGDEVYPPVDQIPSLASRDRAISFLQKYGARPYYEEAPMVRSQFYEAFLAYQTFCLLWSRQFLSDFMLTFMPEIFPGGIVRFPEHDLQMFVDEVTHSFDYEKGFQTRVAFVAPSSSADQKTNVHAGMIRSNIMKTPTNPKPKPKNGNKR